MWMLTSLIGVIAIERAEARGSFFVRKIRGEYGDSILTGRKEW